MVTPYKIGKTPPQWSDTAQTITFIVTEDCNLRCKYCYITHKASNKRMNLDTAKKFIDYILTADIRVADGVVIDFFGGEPLIEVELVDQISDYFKIKAYELEHPWAWNYRFNFATNGVNYSSDEVQRYIRKNYGKLSIGISIDGTMEKHDLNRVFPDGSGSYSSVEKNIPLWISQFSPATKMTFSHDDLLFLKDSVISLWNHGVTEVSANVVFENVWHDGDDIIFENQICLLADYILDNNLYDKYYCTLFSDTIGGYLTDAQRDLVYCGAGKMIAIGPNGKLYPCVRYKDYSLNNHAERVLGSVSTGIDMEKVRPFMLASSRYQDDETCAHCPIASGCPQCQGLSYDVADTATNFQRATFICKMQKARVRANDYFFSKLYNRFGIRRDFPRNTGKVYFLLSDNFVSFCAFNNFVTDSPLTMSMELIHRGLEFCRRNFFDPVFVHADGQYLHMDYAHEFEEYTILHIIPAELSSEAQDVRDFMPVYKQGCIHRYSTYTANCIYNIEQKNIGFLASDVISLFAYADRINVNILDMDTNFNEEEYREQLLIIKEYLVSEIQNGTYNKELNLLTDILYSEEWNNCRAGEQAFTFAPDGNIYACPAFYRKHTQGRIGNSIDGLSDMKSPKLYNRTYHPLCQLCDAKQCKICIDRNLSATDEINVSPSFQCRKSHIERNVSVELQEYLNISNKKKLQKTDYLDPIVLATAVKDGNAGYYKT